MTSLTFPHCHVHIMDVHLQLRSPGACPACQGTGAGRVIKRGFSCALPCDDCKGLGELPTETTRFVGHQVTIQVPEGYHATKKYRSNLGTHCEVVDPADPSELHRPAAWDRHSGYLWFDAPVSRDLKDAFKGLLLELGSIGWWDLAEEIYQQSLAWAARSCDA